MKIILLFLCLIPILVFSQSENQEKVELVIVQTQDLLEQNLNSANVASIQQIGNGNEGEIIQQTQGGLINLAAISQNGAGNNGYISQSGANLTSQLVQISASNSANLWLLGENLSVFANQSGVSNSINAYVESNAGNVINSTLVQEGNQNVIDFAIINSSNFNAGVAQSVGIAQFGNNHSVTAQFENFASPTVNITQNAGFGGAGMAITVSSLPGFTYPNR